MNEEQKKPNRVRTIQSFAEILGFIISGSGLLVFFGWLLDIPLLKSGMSFASSIAFIFLGFALFLAQKRNPDQKHRLITKGYSFLVLAAGFLTLAVYVFDCDWMKYWVCPFFRSHLPEMMAPVSALNFLILGSGLFFRPGKRIFKNILDSLLFIGLLVTLLALFGYIYHIPKLYDLFQKQALGFRRISFASSLIFSLSYLGAYLSPSRKDSGSILISKGAGGFLARRLLLLILVPFIIDLGGNYAIRSGFIDYEHESALGAAALVSIFIFLIMTTCRRLDQVDWKRELMENALREREAFNFALFENNPIQTIVVNKKGQIIRINRAKKNSGDRLPEHGSVLFKDYASHYEIDMHQELLDCIKHNRYKEFPELKYDDKYLIMRIAPFTQGAIITTLNITKRKQAEERLMESYKYLGTINRQLSILLDLHKISHEKKKSEIIGLILESAIALSQAGFAALYRYSEKSQSLNFLSSMGMTDISETISREIPAGSSELLISLKNDKRIVQGSIRDYDLDKFNLKERLKHFMIVPLVVSDRLNGILFLGFKEDKGINHNEMEFFDLLATPASLVIANRNAS